MDLLTETLKENNTIKVIDLEINRIDQKQAEKLLKQQKELKQTQIFLSNRFEFNFAREYNQFMVKLSKKKKK